MLIVVEYEFPEAHRPAKALSVFIPYTSLLENTNFIDNKKQSKEDTS